jgi:hypothetical protein
MAEQPEHLATEKLLDDAIARNEVSLRRIHVCIEKSCKVLRRISKERAETNSGVNAGRAGTRGR